MTSCRDVDRLATAYVDGELDDRRSSAVRGHLRVCASCAERVEDEARVRELAAGLGPLDPPPSMWRAIDAQLAEAEIGDSHRSGMWILAQRVLDVARGNALLVGLASSAAAVFLLLWLPGGRGEAPQRPAAAIARAGGEARPGPEQVVAAATSACGGARTHEELLLCQTHESDRRYVDAIAELTRAVAEERASWRATDAARFDAALRELDHAAQIERVRLAGQPPSAAPANRDSLHDIYRAQLELLSSAVVAGDLSGAAPWRGAP
ncbi:MAG TPA: zf-HC2 domain-containing protein [Kofleriaceae bacterium]|nr:zf-HC2 domain-containing protein [Kofleriaceae bacterium]